MTDSNLKQKAFYDAARASLHQWGWPSECELSLLKYRENAVFGVVSPDGQKAAIRVHRPNYHTATALKSELQWMSALAVENIPVSRAVPTKTGELLINVTPGGSTETFWVDMLAWIEGAPIGSAESRDYADPASVELVYRNIGALAARMHKQSSTWNQPNEFWRPSWDIAGCLGGEGAAADKPTAPLWGKYSDLTDLSSEQRQLLQNAAATATDAMQRFGSTRDRYGLVHADLVPDNLMDTPSGLVVIDFDDCGYSWFLWDLVTAVFWHIGEHTYEAALRGYIAGYRTVRELPDSHLALVPAMLLIRALVYLGWMHTRRGSDTARELTAHVVATSQQLARQLLELDAEKALASTAPASLDD